MSVFASVRTIPERRFSPLVDLWDAAATRLFDATDHIIEAGGRLRGTVLEGAERLPCSEDPSKTEQPRFGWFDPKAISGRSREALVSPHESTRNPLTVAAAT